MKKLEPLWLALGLYSRVPAPKAEWSGENQKAALRFLPVVGVIIGGLSLLWRFVCIRFEIGRILFAAVATAIPVAVTGGFHLDGFCDTIDALGSNQSRERSLEIMKDSRIGAFAAIYLCVYFILCFAAMYELHTALFAAVYVLSRVYVVISAYAMPKAKKSGSLPNFEGNSATLVLLCVLFPPAIWYYRLTKKRFGGITGDTSGYFLQVSELILLALALICERFILSG